MIRFFYDEQWKPFNIGYDSKLNYAISSYGRLASYTDEISRGKLLKGSTIEGYRIFRYKVRGGPKIRYGHHFHHHLVANQFLPNKPEGRAYVLHLDHNKLNNHIGNLKWATQEEMIEHSKTNPLVIEGKRKLVEFNKQRKGHKLTATKVMLIKMKLADPNKKTRLKILAKRFGVSEMTLHRIRTGENWGHVVLPEKR